MAVGPAGLVGFGESDRPADLCPELAGRPRLVPPAVAGPGQWTVAVAGRTAPADRGRAVAVGRQRERAVTTRVLTIGVTSRRSIQQNVPICCDHGVPNSSSVQSARILPQAARGPRAARTPPRIHVEPTAGECDNRL